MSATAVRLITICVMQLIVACALINDSPTVQAQARRYPPSKINPDPNCAHGGREYNLCFDQRGGGVVDNGNVSEFFYAVILRSATKCSIAEDERMEIQRLFPRNKVFATRFECDDDAENNITYTGVDDSVGFVAVFAGRTLPAAKDFLRTVQRTNKFPGANIRRMQVVAVAP